MGHDRFPGRSTLDDQPMRSRRTSARIEARGVLSNHALAFDGFSHRWGRAQVYRQPADTFEPWLPQPGYFWLLFHAYDRLGIYVERLVTAVGAAP
jgi:hypothetical protein